MTIAATIEAPASAVTKAIVLTLSVISALGASATLFGAWTATFLGSKDTEGLAAVFMILIGIGMVYAAVAVWMVPRHRWPLIRWTAAILPAATTLYSAWAMAQSPHILFLAVLAYSAAVAAFLIHPEVAALWQRSPKAAES